MSLNFSSADEIVTLLISALPYSGHISKIDTTSEAGRAVRFTWRGDVFRISFSGMVEEVGDAVLTGSNKAILLEQLLGKAYTESLNYSKKIK